MIRKKFYLVFNLNDGSTIETGFKVVQNDVDAYTINAVIFDGSAPIDYELISSATITYEKPDGKIVQRDMTVESNMITCIVKSNEISVLGVVKASIQLYGEDDERLSLLPFTFEVTKDMISPPVVESTNEFPILQKLVQDVHTIIPMLPEIQQIAFEMPGIIEFFDAAEVSEVQRVANENTRQAQEAARQASIADIINQFNNLVTAKQQEAEVIIARDGEANLKARLDRDKQELSSHMAQKANLGDLVQTNNNVLTVNARIDNLIAVQENTDNAETADIRVGADGKTYASAGDAVRGQINILKGELNRYKKDYAPYIISLNSGANFIDFNIISGNTYSVKNNSEKSIVITSRNVSGDKVEDLGTVAGNSTLIINPTIDAPVLRFYVNTDSAIVEIVNKNDIYAKVNDIYTKVNEVSEGVEALSEHNIIREQITLDFQQGWVASGSGEYASSSTRCRTEKTAFSKGTIIIIRPNGLFFNIAQYNIDGTYEGLISPDWIESQADFMYVVEQDKYLVIGVKKPEDTTITPSNVAIKIETARYIDEFISEHNIIREQITLDFQQGWVVIGSGAYTSSSTRCRTEKTAFSKGTIIIIRPNGLFFNIAQYNIDGTYEGLFSPDWIKSQADYIYVVEQDKYLVIGVRNPENTTITPSDVAIEIETARYIDDFISETTFKVEEIKKSVSKKFYATYETVEVPCGISDNIHSRLSLIATKKDNYHSAANMPIENPRDVGYLYVDETTEKMYYSANKYDNPVYLCDWKRSVADNSHIKDWCPIITPDGDIIFLVQGKKNVRKNPIVYPHTDYNNPIRLSLTPPDGYLPSGLTTDTGACVSTFDDFILWGEYHQSRQADLNEYPMRIWKVTKPYTNPENWRIVFTKYYDDTTDGVNGDDRYITHWHTVCYDHYTGYYYANSGDDDIYCRVFVSKDKGETWTQLVNNGQKWRCLGYIFTEDGCYWGTDSGMWQHHNLYYATRNSEGEVDFSTTVIAAECLYDGSASGLQRTYNTCLLRNPDGILLLDRAEERYDGLLNLEFYSFEDNTLHLVDVLKSSEPSNVTRYGFGNYATTYYQSTQEDGIVCGGMSYDRKMSLAILNNSPSNRVGVTKITIHKINN